MKLPSSPLWKFLSVCLLAHGGAALAQQSPPAQAPAQQTPPVLERIEEGSDVPITVTPPKTGGARITEKREGGRVTEAKVKAGRSEYTMRPNTPAGNAQVGDAVSGNTRAPQWTVLEFDLNKKKNTEPADATGEGAVPPPPPPPAAKP